MSVANLEWPMALSGGRKEDREERAKKVKEGERKQRREKEKHIC